MRSTIDLHFRPKKDSRTTQHFVFTDCCIFMFKSSEEQARGKKKKQDGFDGFDAEDASSVPTVVTVAVGQLE